MNLNFRKILVLGIVIAGILVIILGLFALLGGKSGDDKNIDTTNTTGLPTSGDNPVPTTSPSSETNSINQSLEKNIGQIQQSERIKVLSDRPVMGISLNKEGDRVVYYDKENGQVFRISFDGKIWERISDVNLKGITNITWAPTRDKVLVEYNDSKTRQKYVYDYTSGKKYNLSFRMGQVVFSPDGQKILYHYWYPQQGSNVAVAKYDGSNWFSLFPSEMTGLQLAWPRIDTVTFIAPEGDFYGATVYFIKLESPYNLKEIMDEKYSIETNWSPSGNKLLYSYKDSKDATNKGLYIRDFSADTEINLNFTLPPGNCAWAKNELALYCAQETKNLLNIIPQDYQKKLSLLGDSFWKIDLGAKEIQEIYIPEVGEQVYGVGEIIISDKEDFFFFENKLDGKLYSLEL